jgi:hypothetical protein
VNGRIELFQRCMRLKVDKYPHGNVQLFEEASVNVLHVLTSLQGKAPVSDKFTVNIENNTSKYQFKVIYEYR